MAQICTGKDSEKLYRNEAPNGKSREMAAMVFSVTSDGGIPRLLEPSFVRCHQRASPGPSPSQTRLSFEAFQVCLQLDFSASRLKYVARCLVRSCVTVAWSGRVLL